MKLIHTLIFVFLANSIFAQERNDIIQQRIEFISEQLESESIDLTNLIEQLNFYYDEPININTTNYTNKNSEKNIVDGWLNTGDIGYFDSEGFLFLSGRVDDVINVSGEKVFPEEVESVVLELKGVKGAAVIGVDHKIFGQVVKLFIHKEEDSDLSISQIMSHCIRKLERYKVPVKIEFIDKIPRTDYGKIRRSELRSD